MGVNENDVRVFTDSDWAGCLDSRKSTSGGMMCFGGGLVKSWATTQASIALSVGEAEFYAGIKGAAEAIGFCNLLRDLGIEAKVKLWTDSNTAKSMASKTGAGSARHIDTRYYWIKDVVKKGVVHLFKIDGKDNPSDLLTKPQSITEIIRRGGTVGLRLKTKGGIKIRDDVD